MQLIHGDCLEKMNDIPDKSKDSTDYFGTTKKIQEHEDKDIFKNC